MKQCNCWEKALKAIREHYGDESLSVFPPLDFLSGKMYLEFTVMEKRPTKNNPYRTKAVTTKMLADFCPICGEKYKDKDDGGTTNP